MVNGRVEKSNAHVGCVWANLLNLDGLPHSQIIFSERKELAGKFNEWVDENGIADSAFNVITFLESRSLLDRKKVKEYLRGEKEDGRI